MAAPVALGLRGIQKRFGAVQALRGVNFALAQGSVHALLGENGAGKSTLMHVAFGMFAADAGTIEVNGTPAVIASPRDARRLGLGMVHQHFTSVGALSVAENVALAKGVSRFERGAGAATVLDTLWEGLDPGALVETLSVSLRQRLEIIKALEAGASTLLLDEPTAVLAPAETEELLQVIRTFTAQGGSVVLITHKMDEVFAVADHVTVLRHGRVTLDAPMSGQTTGTLAAAMLGEATVGAVERTPTMEFAVPVGLGDRQAVIILEGLTVAPLEGRGPGLREASLTVHRGELVGVVAVEGNGQRELMLGLAGVLTPATGRATVQAPVALVPEDRSTEALIPECTLTENLALGFGADAPWVRRGWLDWGEASRRTAALLPQYDIRAPSAYAEARQLSGGNQQKLVLARALESHPAVLLVENPTRGLDIAATDAVHQRLRHAAEFGIAVLVYASDLDEVLSLGCDRLLVVTRGRLKEISPASSRGEVGEAMLRGT